MSKKRDLADLFAKIEFSLSAILLFVLGQALSFRATYKDVTSLRIAYSTVSWLSLFLVPSCIVGSLSSVVYLVTEIGVWIVLSLLIFMFVSGVLMFLAFLFGLCALTGWLV